MNPTDPAPLVTGEVAAILGGSGRAIQAVLTALPDTLARWHPAPGEWCVKEALGHLIEAERRGFAGRIRIILDNDEPQFVGWDPPEVARARGDCERDPAELIAEFTAMRAESVALVSSLQDADLARGGHHPVAGHLRVVDLLHEWVHHNLNHFRQMLAVIQAYAWPHMGNTQRFSQP